MSPTFSEVPDSGSDEASNRTVKFLTCGRVDDGKSTLIGRLLYDCGELPFDQLNELAAEDFHLGKRAAEAMPFANLLDGLAAEREQGITIDVGYRFFRTSKRSFTAIDTPGHEQYVRNMVTGASQADLAILVVDASKGVSEYIQRCARILSIVGLRDVILAVNKLDVCGYDEAVFRSLERDFRSVLIGLNLERVSAIPVSALHGDNIVERSRNTPWYSGPTLLHALEGFKCVHAPSFGKSVRFPIQWVNRIENGIRGLAGSLASGILSVGDEVEVSSSQQTAVVARIVTYDGEINAVHPGKAVTLILDRQLDIVRGDVLVSQNSRMKRTSRFQATLIWLDANPGYTGRRYILKLATQEAIAEIVSHRAFVKDVDSAQDSIEAISLNDVATAEVSTSQPVSFDEFDDFMPTGRFVLIDRVSNATVAAGVVNQALLTRDVSFQRFDVTRSVRASMKGQVPHIVWLTGLSGSGKSSIANGLERLLTANGFHTYILDGDNLRLGINKDLGFSESGRIENVRRVAELARLMADAGLIVIVSLISPFSRDRAMARDLAAGIDFSEVFVDTPIDVCEKRDQKGLYQRARRGDIKQFSGVSSPFERPEQPSLVLDGLLDIDELVRSLFAHIHTSITDETNLVCDRSGRPALTDRSS